MRKIQNKIVNDAKEHLLKNDQMSILIDEQYPVTFYKYVLDSFLKSKEYENNLKGTCNLIKEICFEGKEFSNKRFQTRYYSTFFYLINTSKIDVLLYLRSVKIKHLSYFLQTLDCNFKLARCECTKDVIKKINEIMYNVVKNLKMINFKLAKRYFTNNSNY